MDPVAAALLTLIVGTPTFYYSLKFFELECEFWEAVVANAVSASMYLFLSLQTAGLASFAAIFFVFAYLTGHEPKDIWIPVAVSRLCIVPVALLFVV